MDEKTKVTPSVRYSDEELEEFKALILEKLEQARTNLALLNENIAGGENSTNDTAPTFKILEEGYSVSQKEENAKLAARTEKYIQNLEFALMRIENKTYGICRATGKLIPKERLRCVPTTTICLDAKMKEKRKK
ncbi:MAG: TraR/DksA C4-type zinc finger protein [Bacteroidales bacterium]|nr:TraR/DksA C4-type zinc finger protein [Bacteroidales bacterium]